MDRKKIDEIVHMLIESPSEPIRRELLELLFTPNELEQLVARYAIIKGLLKNEQTQRELAAELNLSIAKITRGSNELKRRSVALLNFLNKQIKKGRNK